MDSILIFGATGGTGKEAVIQALEGGAACDQISGEIADASEPTDDNFKLIVKHLFATENGS